MDKVPSIFATNIKSESAVVATPTEDMGEELMETDELETSICDNLLVRVVKVPGAVTQFCFLVEYPNICW